MSTVAIAGPTSMRRRAVNLVMLGLTAVCAVLTLSALAFILGYLVYMGGSSVNAAFFTRLPVPVGEAGGGMANALLGSAKLLALAAVVGIPLGIMAGVYIAEFARPAAAFALRYLTDLLNGVPSIVIGIVAYTLVVLPMRRFSTLAGGVALGVMLVPVVVRGTEEFLRAVPASLREASLALGAPRWVTIARVVLPAASRGILTAVMLGLARVAGETAPLLFTALNNRFWSPGWTEPTASLPVMIFTYAIAPYEDWHRQAWAAALILLVFVLMANVTARLLIRRPHPGAS
jgi:phosphate transport system permease protein